MNKKKLISLILIVSFAVSLGFFSYQVYCAYELWSNTVNVSVTAKAELTLEANVASGYVGDTIELTAFLTDEADNETIYFYENKVEIGSVVTSGGGYAVFNHVLTETGNRVFEASCMHTE